MSATVAFLGLGLMGLPMARNLARGGLRLKVWNRTAEKAQPLAADGAEICQTAAQAVTGADVIISILSDGPATAAVQSDPVLREGLSPGAIWVEMASVKPEEARAQRDDLATLGLSHLDAPVSGGTRGAEAASLAIMVGGQADDVERVQPILSLLGRPVHVGPSGTGQLAKLANQAIVGITIGAVAEAMLLIERGGGDAAAVRAALKGGFADSTVLQQHGQRMTTDDFAPGGLSSVQLKDMENILAEARSLGLTLPQSEGIRDRYVRLCEDLGGGEKDHSALYLELLDRNPPA